MFALKRVVMVCACAHSKRDHWCTKLQPHGNCLLCPCSAFTAEPICRCGHGKKAHRKGSCHEGDGCKVFRPTPRGE
jgi:hypothetical protein